MRQIHGYFSPISCPEQHPGCIQGWVLNISRDGDFTQPLWETWPTVYPHSINHLLCSQGISGVLFCAHWHLPCQRAPLRSFLWIPSHQIFAELPSSHPWSALVVGAVPPHGQDLALLFLNLTPLLTVLWAQMLSWISVHLTVHSFKPNVISLSLMMLRGSLKSLAEVKTNITHSSALIHQTCHLIVKAVRLCKWKGLFQVFGF